MTNVVRLSDLRRESRLVAFNRRELNALLSLYSQRVMRGEWRDYAIDQGPGMAMFAVFRNSADRPLFTILKLAGGGSKAGDYLVCSGRRTLRRAATLGDALQVFERKLKLVSS
jgi:hypothetical protein